MTSLEFLGAAGCVTGSRHLLTVGKRKILLDCGLFQGHRELESRNWEPLPFAPEELDAVILTHAHLDHSGYLPRLVRDGFKGPVHCTRGTADLLSILLPDAGFLQEEEAHHANRKGWSRHRPALPLFTAVEAQRSLRRLVEHPFDVAVEVAEGITVTFRPAGHIIGSAIVEVELGGKRIVFSGDIGRPGSPLLRNPTPIAHADYLLVESTYGDRLHPQGSPIEELGSVVRESVERGGILLIPSFAVGRAQDILFALHKLEEQGEIPTLDVFLDSPMAIDATAIAMEHTSEFNSEASALLARGDQPLAPRRLHVVRDAEGSKALNHLSGPAILMAGSGMCTGGRIRHHLLQRLGRQSNTVLMVGFQAASTTGRALLDGARTLRLFGQEVTVEAHVEHIDGFSAHADRQQLLDWLDQFETPPSRTFVVHGEPAASASLGEALETRGWSVELPQIGERVELSTGKLRFGDVPQARA